MNGITSRMAVVWVLGALASGAAAQQVFEARGAAMGGTGVASADYLAAALYNPALLGNFDENDDFGFILPAVGAVAADEDDLIDAIDAFQEEIEAFEAALDAATVTPAQRTSLVNSLQNLSGKEVTAQFGASFVFALPTETIGVALFGRTIGDARVFATVDPNDITAINTAVNSAQVQNLQSEGRVIGMAVSDVGLSFAKSFDLGGARLSVGVSPKAQRVDSFNYSLNIDNFDEDDFDDSQFRDDDTKFNADAGVAVTVADMLTVGVSVRNLREEDYRTVNTNGQAFTYTVNTIATVGAALDLDFLTLAVDADVTETERFENLADESQYVRAGIEFNGWDWIQLRGGAQFDTEDTTPDLWTAGLGLSPFDLFHLDIAGQIGEDNTYGGVIQTSFTF